MAAAGCAGEKPYPDQPVTLICPWAAGGGTDRVSRQVAALLERELGVPVNVVNATGGSGVTGHTRASLARPDGHTLAMITVELNMLHWRGLTTVTWRDFAPLMLLNRDNAALMVRGDSDWSSLDQVEAALREQPGAFKATGTAQGGIWHVAMAGWLDSRGLDPGAATWISINGAGPSLQELMAGGVDFVCCSLPEADAMLAGGQARCLGVMAGERVPGFEEVPTFAEQGHDWELAGWRGLAAPRDTPPDRLAVLSGALERVTASEEFTGFMEAAGFNVSVEDSAAFAATLESQDELFGAILGSEAFRGVSAEAFGPMIFPAAAGILFLAVLGLVIAEVRREKAPVIEGGRDFRYPAAIGGAALFYLLASESLGFVLAAFFMLGGLLLALRARPLPSLAVAAAASAAVYQLFAVFLRVPLPRGVFGW